MLTLILDCVQIWCDPRLWSDASRRDRHLDGLFDTTLACLWLLGLFDGPHVLLAVGEGQAVERGGGAGRLQGLGQIGRHCDCAWGVVELESDLEGLARGDP